jgi:hypothetical protein
MTIGKLTRLVRSAAPAEAYFCRRGEILRHRSQGSVAVTIVVVAMAGNFPCYSEVGHCFTVDTVALARAVKKTVLAFVGDGTSPPNPHGTRDKDGF